MKEYIKKNLPLVAGLAIPVLMILAIIIAVYVPRIFAPAPKFSLLYFAGETYNSPYVYRVQNGVLIETANSQYQRDYIKSVDYSQQPQLYIYDPKTDTSRETSFREAQNFKLSSSPTSPDGFEVGQGNYSGSIFSEIFGGGNRDYNARYLKGHGIAKRIKLTNIGSYPYYYNDLNFLGWIVE